MSGERTLPGESGLVGYHTPGTGGYAGDGQLDENWRKISAGLTSRLVVESRTTDPLPAAPASPVVYIVASGDATNPNKIAVWDGPAGSEAWVYYAPFEGLQAYVKDAAAGQKAVMFNGTAWVLETTGGFSGFRAIQTSAQSVTTGTTMNLDSADGSDDAFTVGVDIGDLLTDNFFTVPAALNGKYGDFTAGLTTQSDQGVLVVRIERSVNGGTDWFEIAPFASGDGYFGRGNPRTGPVKLLTGNLWRVRVISSAVVNTGGDRSCFFALEVL